ncbi:DNA-(apurinic or apyrimidinic site) lyase 2 [Electrophorus electricus]|uniref:DNA-(apurinic or apyrimidinic site) endonuclease n=1 Tax=Electrophorus electricus TaxID=8005 RepID=A0A4W4HIK3_ELEEL|nr:DNA-(apurinic or apyrimidinic site) lyase 2 [Electrophorus electricus]
MRVVTWNINGIRAFKNGIKKVLDSFDADIICVQETKVTRELLDERTAIVDGYNSYFGFSRGRSGYSGVATFCKDTATPCAAEEGLTGLLANHGEAVGRCGDQSAFSNEELQSLDGEGRAVITQHKFRGAEGSETLTVINVYCPRADPEKPERKLFKLRFYKLLQSRAEALLGPQSHVIVLGDINTSHRPIDHCDPNDVDNFEDNPSRRWLDGFLFGSMVNENADEMDDSEISGGKFVDTFRHFHSTRPNAFTCWSARTGARQTNYGTRIDYIFASRALVSTSFLNVEIMPEVDGSDHCPVWAQLSCTLTPSPRCPALCTRYMPEFAGRQQKLSRFLVKVSEQREVSKDTEGPLPGSQEAGEISENLSPLVAGINTAKKRPSDGLPESSVFKGKRSKHVKTVPKPQGSLLAFFKPKQSSVDPEESGLDSERSGPEISHKGTQNDVNDCNAMHSMQPEWHTKVKEETNNCRVTEPKAEGSCQDQSQSNATVYQESRDKKVMGPDFWKAVLHGPPQPPLCKAHGEPCVLRTVKKAGHNLGRQFFVCARPQGHASNPQARCNFFAWVEKGK